MTTAPLVNGMFRGICVDNKDPKNLGRIRVQVPQILGTSASGWAFPAWSFHQKMIWPQDRLPNPGDGVWVMFDSTSPDKMIWMAAFGPLDLINQPGYTEEVLYQSSLTIAASTSPVWNQICTFSGVLGSDGGGVPNPQAEIKLYGRRAGGSWQALEVAVPDPTTGAWSVGHLVRLTGAVEYRASFEGIGVYGATTSGTLTYTTPVVTFPTALTIEMTDPAPALLKKVPFSGVLSANSAPTDYKIPKGAVVNLAARPAGGAWTTVVSNIPVNETTGAWSAEYVIAIAGTAEYQATFLASGIYLGSQSTVLSIDTSVSTTVSAPVISSLYHGTGFNVSGTVRASTGAIIAEGTATLWWRNTVGSDQAWKQSSASSSISAGNYSMSHPALAVLGPTEWQVRYVGTSKFNSSSSSVVAATVNLRDQGALTKGAISHTSAAFSWAAVSGALNYQIEKWNGSVWTLLTTTTSLSYTDSTLVKDNQYYWRVRPASTRPDGITVYGNYCAQISMTTGHPAVSPTQSSQTFTFSATGFHSHRNDSAGWEPGDMRQGYYSSPYGGEGYIGLANYGGTTIKNAIIAAIGSSAQSSGVCTSAKITLGRVANVGSYNSALSVTFYTSTSTSSGSRPALQGTGKTVTTTAGGVGTYDIGTAHGQRLGDGSANSVAIARNDKTNYLGFDGSGANGGKLSITWAWSSGGISLVSPAWV